MTCWRWTSAWGAIRNSTVKFSWKPTPLRERFDGTIDDRKQNRPAIGRILKDTTGFSMKLPAVRWNRTIPMLYLVFQTHRPLDFNVSFTIRFKNRQFLSVAFLNEWDFYRVYRSSGCAALVRRPRPSLWFGNGWLTIGQCPAQNSR